MMNKNLNAFNSIGKKLMYSFLAILVITTIAIAIAVISINRINKSQTNLTSATIPALVNANNLSSVATNIVEQSLSMDASTSADDLYSIKSNIFQLTDDLSRSLLVIDDDGLNQDQMHKLQLTVDLLHDNVEDKYQVLSGYIEERKKYAANIESMKNSVQLMLDQFLLIKIEKELVLSEEVDGLSSSVNDNSIHNIKNNIYNVEKSNDNIDKLNIIHKSLKNLSDAHSKNNILFYQQEFNHALRVIVRSIVNINNTPIKELLVPEMRNLIYLGQDVNDIFESRLKIIDLENELGNSSKENVSLLHTLNNELKILVNDVQSRTMMASDDLLDELAVSRIVLLILLLLAIVTSSVIVWQFIYKNIVIKLLDLAKITDRLSNGEFDIKIDKKGNDEFSSILETLDQLRIRSREKEIIENQLKEQAVRLNRSNEDLKQFAYVASHDLREPLRMIGSYVQLLKKRYAGKIDDKADMFINYAVDGCYRMQSLIDGLLKFSRVDIDDEDMEIVIMDDVLKDITNELGLQISESKARIHWSDLPDVYARPSQIRTVFRNLLSNAIKYNQSTVPEVYIQGERGERGKIQFSIQDNGIGIEAEYQEKIFVIFKRLHARNEYAGTGIGLSICKKIVERHGGTISLESKPNRGSRFIFSFPASIHPVITLDNVTAAELN